MTRPSRLHDALHTTKELAVLTAQALGAVLLDVWYSIVAMLGIFVLWPAYRLLDAYYRRSERGNDTLTHSARGSYTLDATGDIDGHFFGRASSGYPTPFVDAERIFSVVLQLRPSPSRQPMRGFVSFSFTGAPATGVYHLSAERYAEGVGPRPLLLARFIGRTDGPFAWDGVEGELRLAAAAKGGRGYRGEFSMKLVPTLGGGTTGTLHLTGRFETK